MDANRKAKIKAFLTNCNVANAAERKAVERALQFMFARQTADEQDSAATSHDNGVGFNGTDAFFATSLVGGLEKYGRLTDKQAAAAAKMLKKYAGQLSLMPEKPAAATA